MMKRLLLVPVLAAALAASAFDSRLWLGKREVLTREAERLHAAYTNCLAKVDQPAEGVNVPLETYENGSVKLSVAARKAQVFLDSGLIWAEGVVIRKLDEDGSELSRIEAERCVVDRATKSGWVEGVGRIIHGKTTFTGEGIYFSSPEGYVISRRKTVIETTDLKFGGAL